jgi:hypothetical protein
MDDAVGGDDGIRGNGKELGIGGRMKERRAQQGGERGYLTLRSALCGSNEMWYTDVYLAYLVTT